MWSVTIDSLYNFPILPPTLSSNCSVFITFTYIIDNIDVKLVFVLRVYLFLEREVFSEDQLARESERNHITALSPLAQNRCHLKCACVRVCKPYCLSCSSKMRAPAMNALIWSASRCTISRDCIHDFDHLQLGITIYFSALIKYALQ